MAGALILVAAAIPLTERQTRVLTTADAAASQPLSAGVATATPSPAPQLEHASGTGLLSSTPTSNRASATGSAKTSKSAKTGKKTVAKRASAAASSKVAPRVTLASSYTSVAGTAAEKALAFALDQLGKPYEWGAEGPDSYDCSGLTMRAYENAGYALPRTAAEQALVGTPVDVDHLLPGDLLFYATDPSDLSTVHHVVMYAGAGLIVHAPHTGDVVRLGPMWLGSEFVGAVRIDTSEPVAFTTRDLHSLADAGPIDYSVNPDGSSISAPLNAVPDVSLPSAIPSTHSSHPVVKPHPTGSPLAPPTHPSTSPRPTATRLPTLPPVVGSPQPSIAVSPSPSLATPTSSASPSTPPSPSPSTAPSNSPATVPSPSPSSPASTALASASPSPAASPSSVLLPPDPANGVQLPQGS